MSLFASLDMTAYQVRVMFLDRLRDEYETTELKVAILEFVATCIGKQPGLTEAFFMNNHENVKTDEKDKAVEKKKPDEDDSFEGILGYMADYLGTVKEVSLLTDLSNVSARDNTKTNVIYKFIYIYFRMSNYFTVHFLDVLWNSFMLCGRTICRF